MSFVVAGIAPHPPIAIPEIGGRELLKLDNTVKALEKLSQLFVDNEVRTLVLISPHGPLQSDALVIQGQEQLSGSFARFGRPDISLTYPGDTALARLVQEEAERAGIKTYLWDDDPFDALDHGALVPLYYLNKAGFKGKLLHVTFAFLPFMQLMRFGRLLRDCLQKIDEAGGILASSDLSHRLVRGAPAGYHPDGTRFDRELVGAISRGKVEDILNFDPSMVENAGECGLRSILILLGAVTEEGFKPTVYSYEGPFGVGYMVASYLRKEDNPYIDLAKKALEAKVLGTGLKMPSPLPPELTGKAGVFVSIKKRGQLRGCIGTIEPTKENLAQEIIDNAVSAGLRDPRFPAVEPHELDELTYSVDIMGKPEAVEKLEDLDAKKYGVIVQSGHKRGLLLPDLEGVDTPEQQIAIACQKAGIGSGEKYQLFRFTVTRYQQEDI